MICCLRQLMAVVLVINHQDDAVDRGPKKNDVEWAHHVADDFLELVTHRSSTGSPSEAMGLLTPELAKAILEDQRGANFIEFIRTMAYSEAKITSEEIASDGQEVIYRGIFQENARIGRGDAILQCEWLRIPELDVGGFEW